MAIYNYGNAIRPRVPVAMGRMAMLGEEMGLRKRRLTLAEIEADRAQKRWEKSYALHVEEY